MLDAASRLYSRQTNQSVPRNQGKTFVRLPFDGCGNIDDVLRLALKDIDNLPPNQTAAAWTFILRLLTTTNDQRRNRSLGRVAIDVQGSEQLEQQLDALFQHTMNSLDEMKHKELATVILSIAKVVKDIREASQMKRQSVYHQALESLLQKTNPFGHFAMAADRKLIEFDARHLSNLAYAYALVGYNPKLNDGSNLFQKIGDRSIICIDHFKPQGLTNILWACAKLNMQHAALFKTVGDQIVQSDDLVPFKPQELANILWAYATISTEHTRLFKKVGDHIVQLDNLASFKPQDIAIIVWAYAKLDEQNAALFQVVGDHMIKSDDLAAFKPQELANVVWAYSKSGVHHAALLKTVGDHIVQLDDLTTFKPQDLANILWAYATADVQHPQLFNKFGNHVVQSNDLAAFKPQNLSNILWAYAKTNTNYPVLFKQIGDSIVSFGSSKPFIPQELANIVWAYAKVGEHHPDLFKMIGYSIAALNDLTIFQAQALANIAWAYAMAEIHSPFLFNERFAKELLERQHQFNDAELRQLYQWHVWQTKEKAHDSLLSPLKEKCIDANSIGNKN